MLLPLAASAGELGEAERELTNLIDNIDPPEVFEGTKYPTDIRQTIIDDIDGDDVTEAIALVRPRFRQTPTILFFRKGANGFHRVMEGLAPGPLVPVTEHLEDTHRIGLGVDFRVEESRGTGTALDVIKIAARETSFGALALYPAFIHADGRTISSQPFFVNLLDSSIEDENCLRFQFSEPIEMAVGTLEGTKRLAVWTGDDIYVYTIKEFQQSGFIEKYLVTIRTPVDFKGFAEGSRLGFLSSEGVWQSLPPNKALHSDRPRDASAGG